MSTPTLDTLASAQLESQLTEVEERLAREYGDLAPEMVHDLVERERSRFADAHIHAFVPILIERAVRTSLAGSPAKHRKD